MTATIERAAKEHAAARIMELVVEDTLRERGYGLIALPRVGTRRTLLLVTDGSLVGGVTAYDAPSLEFVEHYASRSEASIEVDLSGTAESIRVTGVEVHQWIEAVWRFLATGEYSEAVDWTAVPSARCATAEEYQHGERSLRNREKQDPLRRHELRHGDDEGHPDRHGGR